MAIKFNGTQLSVAKKQKFNGSDVTKIIFNGTTVWEYDTQPHPAPNLSSILTPTRRVSDFEWHDGTGGHDGYVFSDDETEGYNYIKRSADVRAFWTGGHATAEAWYTGTINKLNLPNGSEVKTLIVYKYGRYSGSNPETFNVSNVNSVSVSDHDIDGIQIAVDGTVNVTATAGISRVDYKYV